ncbi:MAG: hypothetical protein QM831_04310 [Kofleriaceae bacterium]
MTFSIDCNLDQEALWLGQPLKKEARVRATFVSLLLPVLAPPGEVTLHVLEPSQLVPPIETAAATVREVQPPHPATANLRWADPAAKHVNDRRFALELGLALPGTQTFRSLEQLERILATEQPGKWVAKAPWSAAGRSRIHGVDNAIKHDDRIALPRLLAFAGELVYEPWMNRQFDLAVCGTVGDSVELLPPHTLLSGPNGSFHGIDLTPPALEAAELDQLLLAAERAGHLLQAHGYRGPFGIDAFVYSTMHGRQIHPLCEINARHTFGHVAHAFHRRFGYTKLHINNAMPPTGHPLASIDHRVIAWSMV